MAKGRARRPGTMDEPKYRRLLVGLPPDLDDALRSAAASEDRPLAWVVRQALEHYLSDSRGFSELPPHAVSSGARPILR